MSGLITYKIVKDRGEKLKTAARTACNFWNHYIAAEHHVVIRLGLFTKNDTTIANSYKPHTSKGVIYGRVDFNTKYLDSYSDADLAGTLAHELGHTLGFGWKKWLTLFYPSTGRFKPEVIEQLPSLKRMFVEIHSDEATRLAHWEEAKHGSEMMTGFEDKSEFVLPVTIDVMRLLGHRVVTRLNRKTSVKALMTQSSNRPFTRRRLAKRIDREHFHKTAFWEKITRS